MKYYFITLLVLLSTSCNAQDKIKPVGKSEFQIRLNKQFKDASTSPLTKKGLRNFKGLDFFPINKKFKVTAKLHKTKNNKVLRIPTTTSRIALYKQYGVLTFSINEKEYKLNIYKNAIYNELYKDHLFLPFLDKTNGKTSYSGGRFIDILTTDEKNGAIEIDFNKAYNPYCAYSNRYSCPITPNSNYLDIEINAGVMAYKKE